LPPQQKSPQQQKSHAGAIATADFWREYLNFATRTQLAQLESSEFKRPPRRGSLQFK
jgi:hypothetical protein